MNPKTITTAALLLLAAGAAFAQEGRAAKMMGQLQQRFAAADANADGKLTRDEAGKMPWVHKNFDAIDAGKSGSVTMPQIQAYAAAQRGKRNAP